RPGVRTGRSLSRRHGNGRGDGPGDRSQGGGEAIRRVPLDRAIAARRPDRVIAAHHICKAFGGIRAVDDCSLAHERGQILGLIGPNGDGKTTLFNILAGFMRPDAGRIELNGEEVTGRPPHELFRRGLVRTFQIAHELARMTVLENLMVVPSGQSGESLLTAWFRPGRVASQERVLRHRAEDVLRRLKLSDLRFELAGNLSGGQKKLLELGRAMMSDAKVVLLDEIGAGVSRGLMAELA